MKSIKQSIITRILVHALLFSIGFLFLLNAYHFKSFISKYPSTTTTFEQTEFFYEKYIKYVERVAEYIQYKEKGYQLDANHVYENPDIASILDTEDMPSNHTKDKDPHTDYTNQDAFEYYNQVLNIEKTNFIYYVKNTKTGDTYYSPFLLDRKNYKNPEDFLTNIEHYKSYLVINTNTSRYATNISNHSKKYIDPDDISWVIKCITGSLPKDSIDDSNEITDLEKESSRTSDSNEYIIYTAISNNLPYNDIFKVNRDNFYQLHHNYSISIYILPISIIFFIILFILLIFLTGNIKKETNIIVTKFDNIYTELAFTGIVGTFILLIYYVILPVSRFILFTIAYPIEVTLLFSYSFAYPIPMFGFLSLIRRIKKGTLISNSIIYKLCKSIKNKFQLFFLYKDITYQIALTFGIFIGIKLIASLCILFIKGSYGLLFYYVISIIAYLYAAYYLFKFGSSLHIIVTETKQIADGDLNHKIPQKVLTGYLGTLGNYINHIGDGLSGAVDEKIKSERLKTELITNVSHDIKTPLTSIINYVDLLKKENLENETATSYLKVLESKSWRLKTLIEDLVEVSKASSGTTKLNLERINIVELIRQSTGEFEDRFLSRNLEIVVNITEEPIYILADGRSTFRIIENIFSNVNKYALSGTRVYVDVIRKDKKVSISVKNISANKLNIDSNELMERFVRGDIARKTEGSGLGLSIAESLASLQNATFDIVLDGDLFKAIVCFTTIE